MKGVKWKSIVKSVAVFMSLFVLFVTSSANTSAASVSSFSFNIATGGNYYWATGKTWGQDFDATYIRRIEPHFTINQVTGNYATLTSTFNLVSSSIAGSSYRPSMINDSSIKLEQVVMSGSARKIEGSSVNYAITDWYDCDGGDCIAKRTFTFYITAVISGYSTGSNVQAYYTIGSDTAFIFNNERPNTYFYLENDPNNVTDMTFGTDLDTALLNSIASNQLQTTNAVNNVNQTLIDQQNQDNQDREELQNSQSDADDAADSSSAQAESTGSTLLQAFTSFVNALTSASPSDCNINFNIMGYINGGNVNLCQLSLPPAFQAIGTLLLIGFCVPLSIATARKIIGLFRSFQS